MGPVCIQRDDFNELKKRRNHFGRGSAPSFGNRKIRLRLIFILKRNFSSSPLHLVRPEIVSGDPGPTLRVGSFLLRHSFLRCSSPRVRGVGQDPPLRKQRRERRQSKTVFSSLQMCRTDRSYNRRPGNDLPCAPGRPRDSG